MISVTVDDNNVPRQLERLGNDEMLQQCKATLCMSDGQVVRCIRQCPCLFDDHLGAMQMPDGTRGLVVWGRDAEARQREFGRGSYPVIPCR